MLIILKQSEIEAALKQFIGQQGINIEGKTIDVSFSAGRKDNGISAELDISEGPSQKTNRAATAFIQAIQEPVVQGLPEVVEAAEPEPVKDVEANPKTTSLFG